MASPTEVVVDVFICGGGPVGLLIAYTLARMGISTYIVGTKAHLYFLFTMSGLLTHNC